MRRGMRKSMMMSVVLQGNAHVAAPVPDGAPAEMFAETRAPEIAYISVEPEPEYTGRVLWADMHVPGEPSLWDKIVSLFR